jgi:hypothetical protein
MDEEKYDSCICGALPKCVSVGNLPNDISFFKRNMLDILIVKKILPQPHQYFADYLYLFGKNFDWFIGGIGGLEQD